MREIQGFNFSAEEVSRFDTLVPGLYVCCIVGVEDVESKEYLKVQFDIVRNENGKFANYFKDMYDKNSNFGWPIAGTFYRSYKETAKGFFERFITVISKSNANFKWNWDERTLEQKLFIGVFQEEEYINSNNEVKCSVKLQEVRSVEAYKNGDIKFVEKRKEVKKPVVKPVINDEDLPF